MLHQPEIVKELKIIAARYNISYAMVVSIVETYYQQVADEMSKADKVAGYYPTIAVPFFGKFMVKTGRIKHFNKEQNESKETKSGREDSDTEES